jgi:hypothetical protein
MPGTAVMSMDIEWTSEIAQAIEGAQRVYRGREEMRR